MIKENDKADNIDSIIYIYIYFVVIFNCSDSNIVLFKTKNHKESNI